jgi:hypothetical protein
MTDGDILKRDELIWNFTLEEIRPYLDHKIRNVTFREAVLGFLGVKTQGDVVDEYCKSCRAAGKDHCDTCDRDIQTIEEPKKRKTIG